MSTAIQARPALSNERDTRFCEDLFTALRSATGDGIGITRESFGAGESVALDLIEKAARELDLATERYAGANLVVTFAGTEPELPYLACGSHLDSVPQGGNFDGGAGVIASLAVVGGLKRDGLWPRRTLICVGLRGEVSGMYGQCNW